MASTRPKVFLPVILFYLLPVSICTVLMCFNHAREKIKVIYTGTLLKMARNRKCLFETSGRQW